LYYAAQEHRDRIDSEVVMPGVSWKMSKAKRRLEEAPAEPSKI
jgi:hypothetical protein